ncbi:MAG: peroxide stress protein YaaA [Proteobacteria bacterium]|nr:peroxide stress protein YaaA [Pseudomonadota bacterium]MDA1070759.1 peroxide stress protein YaaA [Pseudomonadota bacterium]
MLAVVSPAKALDFSPAPEELPATQPALFDQTLMLAKTTRRLSKPKVAALMDLSDKLAELNVARFRAFAGEQDRENAKQAVLAFAGDTYRGLDAASLSQEDLAWAQDHLRLLSGLYGVLRPLDLIQPYRLEMGTRLATRRGETLYDFWGDRVTQALNESLKGHEDATLVNLASIEYFGVVRPKKLAGTVITPIFREERDGVEKIISFSAKKARGMMARYILTRRLDRPEGMKDFAEEGYRFRPKASSERDWVFSRKAP